MQQDGSSTTRVPRQQHQKQTATRQRASLAGIGGRDGCGWTRPQQQQQELQHMDTSCGSHWQEKDLCWRNACRCSKEAATQRRKGGGTIGRWSGKLDDCGGRVDQHKEG
jgi:hypothetical protein